MSNAMKRIGLAAALAVLMIGTAEKGVSAGVIVDKVPDQGATWQPLGGSSGTYVYANSFVFTGTTGTELDVVGIYLLNQGFGPGTDFRFEVYADNGNAPDPTTVLGVTAYMNDANTDLHLDTANLLTPFNLVNGTRYWIAASTVGQDSDGSYEAGGHTQNSIYNDNGTFWYSNDPTGQDFDGQAYLPEMAIYAASTSGAVPEPASLISTGSGILIGLAYIRRRKARRTA